MAVLISFTINPYCYDAVMRDVEFHEERGDLRDLFITPTLRPSGHRWQPLPNAVGMSLAALVGPSRPVSPPRFSAANPIYLDQKCTICREDFDDDFKVLRCGHVFCTVCIRRWYRVRQGGRTCPTCKESFVRTDVY